VVLLKCGNVTKKLRIKELLFPYSCGAELKQQVINKCPEHTFTAVISTESRVALTVA
jgi:hypothetical protein